MIMSFSILYNAFRGRSDDLSLGHDLCVRAIHAALEALIIEQIVAGHNIVVMGHYIKEIVVFCVDLMRRVKNYTAVNRRNLIVGRVYFVVAI